jgi:hypothetical protein
LIYLILEGVEAGAWQLESRRAEVEKSRLAAVAGLLEQISLICRVVLGVMHNVSSLEA